MLPTFNRGGSLLTAVESVLTQTTSVAELIVVDDASTDPVTADVFDDRRVTVLHRAENGGVAAAQNTGVHAATTEFVAFIHSDDRWLPGKVTHQLSVMDAAGSSVAAVESATCRHSSAGARVVAPRLEGRSYDELFGRQVKDLHISGFLFRRDPLVSIGGFDEALRAYEDLDLLIRLCRAHEVDFSAEPVSVIDQRGADRLGASPWMPRGREHLLAKYDAALTERFGHLPAGWRDWSLQAALSALESGDGALARRHLSRSLDGSWGQRLRRAPLVAASYGGSPGGRLAAATYGRVVLRRPAAGSQG